VGEIPVASFTQISAAYLHTCGVTKDQDIECWGTTDPQDILSPPKGRYEHVSAGRHHVCGLTTEGDLSCWGSAEKYQAPPTGNIESLESGMFFSCAILEDGQVDCFGKSSYGETVDEAETAIKLGTGEVHVCAIVTPHELECWGWNMATEGAP
jgi:alpha-tubulin suppressor-like RCC1 family protein